jgi:hypothetical protein
MNNLSEVLEHALPAMEKFSKAKKTAIGEALAAYKAAKAMELDAMNALLNALKGEYQFWSVEGRVGKGPLMRRILPGTSGPDAEKRAKKTGFTTILHISPLESTDGPQD